MDRFDDGEIEESGDRRRIHGIVTVMVITFVLAAAAKAIPA